ncbi:endonuclease/exonuclease/phosphatase family protein [Candidatus Enterovibrio altilux]|uniref:endonuclease/exonuclease/phosphatase family protein n=1 Tax=Candidatus Enterovibrio altilux TaxID=1927128 RepID=UPI001237CCD9|nr:endonuclease/exonuclease/phosphatase family protein [Candidatus Enterovibrio luxaltus]
MIRIKKGWLVSSVTLLFFLIFLAFERVFEIPEAPSLANHNKNANCVSYTPTSVINIAKPLSIAVWNIYKQKLAGWEDELLFLSKKSSLILLQEAQSTVALQKYISARRWHSNQVFAFAIHGEIAGVMTLSNFIPEQVCAYTKIEPYLRLPKSALHSEFPLSNGQTLSVINIHSINFTFGIDEYKQQLYALFEAIASLEGPLIIAGDFNTWSLQRLGAMKAELIRAGLIEASIDPDERLTIFKLPLDHIYYRGLTLDSASSQKTNASDHAIIMATFSFFTD